MSFRKILTTAVGVPETASDDEIAKAMAELMNPPAPRGSISPQIQASDDAQERYRALAEATAKAKNISLNDAYSLVSRDNPEIWNQARQAADINRVML